jgi:hypothetical protein
MGKSKTQRWTQNVDPRSQQYVDRTRGMASTGAQAVMGAGPLFAGPLSADDIQAAMNPSMTNVVDATRGEFDHLRGQAAVASNQEATGAGAFGGSRAAIAQGTRLGELDRAQTGQIAGLLSEGYGQAVQFAEHQRGLRERQMQEPLFRAQSTVGLRNLGMGPMGQSGTSTMPGDLVGDLAGIGMVGAGLFAGGPAGAAAGAKLAGMGTKMGGMFGGGAGGGANAGYQFPAHLFDRRGWRPW